jgi:hypothetical protein
VNEVLKSLLAVVPGLAAEHAGRIRRQIDTRVAGSLPWAADG